ncbi:hypothetical protein BDQ12DRAFT_684301 [Crucibulum laeve]|uniref:Polo kinase n=1 Tax=Crucibulum laeve TaxID=68775 RepID=A0A5C3M0J7_9AGAR|nr:hypothetical protein BDQ12DRAFT_684301 [Crucibulum laeve]
MTLELCPSGSLMDMLRRRRRFTEPEARFFMVQLIGACHYMHTHQVIHRDLKLGNLFLDANMNVKVGDFGLAALIENPGERKKTICGTPNYIAPEVLFDTANGHSFEVDTWSIGVILYTLVVGRPPFQTKDVKAIYKRIRDNEYEFPTERAISSAAQHLIQQILTPNPQQRPTLHEIVDHTFFTQGPVPSYVPTSAHDAPPDFKHISKVVSDSNLKRLRRYALLDEDQLMASTSAPAPALSTAATSKNMTSSIAQQEKEFQKAVQPGSPISALLSSARQPLLMGSSQPSAGVKESPLMRKLQAVKESPLRRQIGKGLGGVSEGREGAREEEHRDEEEEEIRLRTKELEAQKARIVAQMAPVREEPEEEERVERGGAVERQKVRERERERERLGLGDRMAMDRENIPPSTTVLKKDFVKAREAERPRDVRVLGKAKENVLAAAAPAPAAPTPKLNGFDAAAHILSLAFEAKSAGKVFRHPDSHIPLPEERVFIVSWVDYCNKYGMGYALTDGSVGVHFNDSTSLVLSPDKLHFDYITSRRLGSVYMRKSHTVDVYPDELKSKVYLLKHFERYIMDRLYGEYDYTFEDVDRQKGMEWVQQYLRMKHVIVFKLSHDVLQFNFYDHSKLILSSHGLLVTHIDKHYKMTRWSLSDIMAQSLSLNSNVDPDHLKFIQRLVDKLKYCKEVLISIRTARASGGNGVPEETDAMGASLAAPTAALGSKVSKASLR